MKTKSFVALLTVALIISCLSFTAIADEGIELMAENIIEVDGVGYSTYADAAAAITNNSEVKLLDDVTMDKTYFGAKEGETLTLDLNGFTLTRTWNMWQGNDEYGNDRNTTTQCVIYNRGTLTIKDSVGTGVIQGHSDTSGNHGWNQDFLGAAISNAIGAVINYEGGKTTRGDLDSFGYYTVYNKGTFNMKGGSITNGSSSSALFCNVAPKSGETHTPVINVTGGVLQQDDFLALKLELNTEADISGGEISCTGDRFIQNRGDLTITDGIFTGAYSQPTDSGVPTVTVEGGQYSDISIEDYLPDGVKLFDNNGIKTLYTPVITKFEKTAEKGVFDICLTKADCINEFVAAEIKFVNSSVLESGAEMVYEIIGTDNVAVERNLEKEDVYLFSLKADEQRLSGNSIVIGQVKFSGYGSIEFNIDETYNNVATATEVDTHLAHYYKTADKNLIAGDAATSKVELPKRDIEISFDFKHPVDALATEEYLGVKAVLKDIYGNETETALAGAAEVITFEAVPVGRVTLTLSAPGYRTYVYTTVVEEDAAALSLNFWTDVKRDTLASPLAEIEEGKGAIATSFLVGDIAMDYIVDKYDLAAVTSYYGTYGITAKTAEEIAKLVKYDLNRDGSIDITDVGYVLHTMGH